MALPQKKSSYTFADYLLWEGEGRIEIMDGQIIMMSPPKRIHQEISVEIVRQLANFLDGKKCRVYAAPFAVRLFEEDTDTPEDVQTVFEPDIVVVCDLNKLDDYGCKGAPDMVIEILSSSTLKHDMIYKMRRYEEAGIKEYWVVNPKEQSVQVYTLESGYKITSCYTAEDIAEVSVLDGCFIKMSKVFPNP